MRDGTNDYSKNWVPSIRCKEKYKDKMLEDYLMALEFDSDDWICPDVEHIDIFNYPSLFEAGQGISFNMVINTCKAAVDVDEKNGLVSYVTDKTQACYGDDDTSFKATASSLAFKGKMMT